MLDPRRKRQLHQLIAQFGLPPTATASIRWEVLDRALTHATISPDRNYELLEFVGDAVVRLVAAEFLFQSFPDASEGELSAIRSVLVSDRVLAQLAEYYDLDRYLHIAASAAHDKTGEESRLAAAFEAMLAALYLSTQDLTLITPWLNDHLQEWSDVVRQDPTRQNYKGALQDWTQAHYHVLPDYRVTEIGTAHGDRERFLAEVWFQGHRLGYGKGQSKKAAEQAAAQMAYHVLADSSSSDS